MFAIFVLLILSVNHVFLYSEMYSQRVKQEIEHLAKEAYSHRMVLTEAFDQKSMNQAVQIGKYAGHALLIVDREYSIITSDDPMADGIQEQIVNQLLIYDQMLPIEGSQERYAATETYIVVASPLIQNDSIQGYVIIAEEKSEIEQFAMQMLGQFVFVSVITIGLFILAIYALTQLISIPLRTIDRATEELVNGNYRVVLQTERNDELGKLAGSIQALSSKLQQIQLDRNDFLADISHELRTPLTYLKGYAEISKRSNISEQERIKYAGIIQEEAERLSVLVKDLFDLAQAERHQLTINKRYVNLRLLTQQVIDTTEATFSQHGIQLLADMREDIYISIDPIRFSQVLFNLLDNALKYTPDGEGKSVYVTIWEFGSKVELIIKNEGEGIPASQLEHIWERFYRIEKSRSRLSGGSGLGLTIARKIVELHGGTIGITSDVGENTVVTITLYKEGKQDV